MIETLTPAATLTKPLPTGRLLLNRGLTGLAFILTGLAILPLFSVLFEILRQGISHLNWDILSKSLLDSPIGFFNVILGTLMMVGLAAAFSVPIGLLTAIYLSELGKQQPLAQGIRFAVNILSAVPSIVIGVFAYAVVVLSIGHPSALAGSFALSVVMLPIIILAAEEALKLISAQQRAASAALGANQFQTTFRIVVFAALPGITTAILLAVARAAGETAPLIFTAQFSQNFPDGLLNPSPSLAVMIYNFSNSADPVQNQLAWSASVILVGLVLCLSLASRFVTRKR
jgi:phosphate transport system permease protein